MILGIDATNIRTGGGLTHLKEVLEHAEPAIYGFEKVIIWSNFKTLNALPNLNWLQKRSHGLLNNSFLSSFLFQMIYISKQAKQEKCDLIFVPGGTFFGSFPSIVSMSQNMLPFENEEKRRFVDFKMRLKLELLHYSQKFTFKKSNGIIFLTKYAKDYITSICSTKNSIIIPHGINLNFLNEPRAQRKICDYSFENPYKLLYVSIIAEYKHQWNVAEAVIKLRKEGYPIILDLVGPSMPDALKRLHQVLIEDKANCISYKGEISNEDLSLVYKNADAFIFASSCENMPIILLEAASSGLPIVSSNMGPMPEILGAGGFYFNPLEEKSVYLGIKRMIDSIEERKSKVKQSYQQATSYTWKECSDRTFEYLSKVAINIRNLKN